MKSNLYLAAAIVCGLLMPANIYFGRGWLAVINFLSALVFAACAGWTH